MNPNYWTIKYGGVTQTAAAWGIANMKRSRESGRTDTVTFSLPGWNFASPVPFGFEQQVTIYAGGEQWFAGWVTQLPRKGSATMESQDYVISGPWYWLEKTPFQQMWVYNVTTGGVTAVSNLPQGGVILGQSATGAKLHSGQVILEALLYAQYAFQGTPYPNEVITAEPTGGWPTYWPSSIVPTDFIQLPSPPNPEDGAIPFQIGTVTPDVVTVYSETKNKFCADIIRLAMRFSPDAVAWTDHTTSPPTIHIDRRSNLDGRTISVLDGTVVGEFNPSPRYDLVPSAVIVKYQQTNTINGAQKSFLHIDQYPTGVADNNPHNLIFTQDLVGGHTTTQTANITTTERPVAPGDSSAMSWYFTKQAWLKAQKPAGGGGAGDGSSVYDTDSMYMSDLDVAIDPNDPLNTSNPNNITLPSCPQLVNELLGAFPGWFQSTEELDSATVTMTTWVQYGGTDPLTQTLFWFDPANPTVPKTDGSGYLPPQTVTVRVTNASTGPYTRLTSAQSSEPVPMGVAQYIYESLAQLHWDGEIVFQEEECSDRLPLGAIWNANDGDALWASMDALVVRVTEDVDNGRTTVRFGPPLVLGLGDLMEIIRAAEGTRPVLQLAQRTSGDTATGADVTETHHAGGTSVSTAPGAAGAAGVPSPWDLSFRKNPSDPAAWQVSVNKNSTLTDTTLSAPTAVTVTGADGSWNSIDNSSTIAYLSAVVASLVTGTVNVDYCGAGGAYIPGTAYWSAGSQLINDGASPTPNQTAWNLQIASIDWSSGSPVATNLVGANLNIVNTCAAGLPAVYPSV